MVAESVLPFLTQKLLQEMTSVRQPEKVLALFDENHSSGGREWNGYARAMLGEFISKEAAALANFEANWDGKERWNASKIDPIHATLNWK